MTTTTDLLHELAETYLTDEEQVELSVLIDDGDHNAAKRYLHERVRALVDAGTVGQDDLEEVRHQLGITVFA